MDLSSRFASAQMQHRAEESQAARVRDAKPDVVTERNEENNELQQPNQQRTRHPTYNFIPIMDTGGYCPPSQRVGASNDHFYYYPRPPPATVVPAANRGYASSSNPYAAFYPDDAARSHGNSKDDFVGSISRAAAWIMLIAVFGWIIGKVRTKGIRHDHSLLPPKSAEWSEMPTEEENHTTLPTMPPPLSVVRDLRTLRLRHNSAADN